MAPRTRALVVTLYLAFLTCACGLPAEAQWSLKAGDTASIKFGILLHAWADWQQTPNQAGTAGAGYQQNLFIRRLRFLTSGQITQDLTFLFFLDSSNIGKNKAPGASLSPGVVVFDAFAQWKVAKGFQVQGGYFYVPFSRSTLTASGSFPSLDFAQVAFLSSTPVGGNSSMRDTGFGTLGFLLGDRLHYRAGVYQGIRDVGGRNSFRYAGRLQYEFLDTETGYLYPGTNLGKKRILAAGIGTDNQADFHAYSADVFADIPTSGGNAAVGLLAFYHYDGGLRAPALPRQNAWLLEAGYYLGKAKLEPFFQFQSQCHANAIDQPKDYRRYQLGTHYYVSGQNLKLTAAYTRLVPERDGAVATNQFTIQLQALYY